MAPAALQVEAAASCGPAECGPAGPNARTRWFQMLADPTRMAILTLLLTGPHHVGQIVAATRLPQSRISNHLACLRTCRLVVAERQGRRVLYRIGDPRLRLLLDLADDLAAGSNDLTDCGF
ncbi:metalloregulator ArsR/SmtB family transcription factor [Solwaraspora sp. WMMD792]|uniref:ArsR/SmtB family transcription factor n=1 Tax=Solwaraspora sp. WMMD792 TaxID=3016099 RepID=UPI003242BA4A